MLDFKVQLALGDQQLSEAEWRELMAADDGLVMLRGQWVEVDRQKLQEALDHWKQVEEQAQEGISFLEGMRLLAGVPADLTEEAGERKTASGRLFMPANGSATSWPRCAARKTCNRRPSGGDPEATLRPYQETGVNWLRFLSGLGLGACLADDMGLGKTIQVLALLLALKSQKRRNKSPRSWCCRPRCWATGRRRWPASRRRFAPSSCTRPKRPRKNSTASRRTPPRRCGTSTWS